MKNKPAVIAWFKNNPEANAFFDPVKGFLVQHYSGANHGFINRDAYPDYRFNSARGKGEIYVNIRARQGHTVVRIRIKSELVHPDFSDYQKTIAGRSPNERIDVVDFVISETEHLKVMNDFFRVHKIDNFTVPSKNAWKKFDINSAGTYKSIRTTEGRTVEVTHGHLELSKKFIKWLKRKGYRNIKDEFVLANFDRIDVRFELEDKKIFSELKTVSGRATKRAIRQALGQILDYQYYDDREKADELWIVVNDECTNLDVQFIKQLVEKHELPLRLVWEKRKGFASFPELESRT
jgi:hypothetical protein